MKLYSNLVIILLILAFQNLSFSATKCIAHYRLDGAQFIKYPDDIFMAFRSNNSHYWSYIKKLQNSSDFSLLFSLEGIGIGDFHFLNIGDIELKNHQRKMGMIDVDDATTKTPILFDLARQLLAAEFSSLKVNKKNFFDFFFLGLNNTPTDSVFVKNILNKTPEDFKKKYDKMLAKYTLNSHFNESSGILPLSKAASEVSELFVKMEPAFQRIVKDYDLNAQILDIGFRIKSSGGSKGIPRFVFLIQKTNGSQEIIEFKQFVNSSAEKFSPQGSKRQRFNAATNLYRPAEEIYGLYDLVEVDTLAFVVRTKLPSFLDFNTSDEMTTNNKKNLQDFIEYSLNQYGLVQRNQLTSEQIQWLTENRPFIENQLSLFIELYKSELYFQNTKEKR